MKINNLRTKIITWILAFALLSGIVPRITEKMEITVRAASADYFAGNDSELTNALDDAVDGDIITLTDSFTYNTGITVSGKSLTLDLSVHTLTVVNTAGSGVSVSNNGTLTVTGMGGTLDVTGDYMGIEAYVNGEFKADDSVTVKAATDEYGVCVMADADSKVSMTGEINSDSCFAGVGAFLGGEVTIYGDITVTGEFCGGVLVEDGGIVTVNGNVTATGDYSTGVDVTSGIVTVNGSVTADGYFSRGAKAYDGAEITIDGDITVTGEDCYGVYAQQGESVTVNGNITATGDFSTGVATTIIGIVTVKGNVTATGKYTFGVTVYADGEITIDGVLSATGAYIILEGTVLTAGDYTSINSGYFEYADGSNTVRVKAPIPEDGITIATAFEGQFRDDVRDWERDFGNNTGILSPAEINDIEVIRVKSPSNTPTTIKLSDTVDNLTGIEVFKNLDVLECSGTQITGTLDVSAFTVLTNLSCDSTGVTELVGLDNLSKLAYLYCHETNITEIDLSGGFPDLMTLSCGDTGITELDLSKVPGLESLTCERTEITELNLSKVPNLKSLVCDDTGVSGSLDLSKVPELTNLSLYSTRVTELVGLSGLNKLETLICSDTDITELNLNALPQLETLACTDIPVHSLDLSALTSLILGRAYAGGSAYYPVYTPVVNLDDLSGFDISRVVPDPNTGVLFGNADYNAADNTLTILDTDKPVAYWYDTGCAVVNEGIGGGVIKFGMIFKKVKAPSLKSKTETSVTLNGIAGAEYRLGKTGAWQTSPVFEGLEPNKSYVFYSRMKATATRLASDESSATVVFTVGDGAGLHISSVNATENGGWIEITNSANKKHTARGMFLTNDGDNPNLWKVPCRIMKAGETVRIRADGNESDEVMKRMSACFAPAVGETLRLSDGVGVLFEVELIDG